LQLSSRRERFHRERAFKGLKGRETFDAFAASIPRD
jgi:hypothetical protein